MAQEAKLTHLRSDNVIIQEGKAELVVSSSAKVFYNPVQEFNRDISIAVLSLLSNEFHSRRKTCKRGCEGEIKENVPSDDLPLSAGVKYDNGFTILEALAASGLRSIRYAKEIPGLKEIIANDISVSAVETMKKNIYHNDVGSLITASHSDASLLMYQKKSEGITFDAIDLDPYGCPSRFLDAAVQTVCDGGVLLVTCTDMAILAGNSPETCYVKYGAVSLKLSACHEMALRIALQCIESHANRYGRYIQPLLSISVDFYIRLVVRITTSPVICKQTTSKLSHVYQCVGCRSVELRPLGLLEKRDGKPPKYSLPRLPQVSCCQHCSGSFQVGGPVWSAHIHDKSFIAKLLEHVQGSALSTERRITGLLDTVLIELTEAPLYNTISSLCSTVHCEVIPLIEFRSALLNMGYEVSLSHAAPNSIKTNAPMKHVWDVVRTWVQTHPVAAKRLADSTSAASRLLAMPPSSQVSFTVHPQAALRHNVLRYQTNPSPNWGPGHRSTTNLEGKRKGRKVIDSVNNEEELEQGNS